PFGDLRLAPLLDAQAEIAAAAGDAATTREAAVGLRAIADAYRSRALDAAACLAAARASVAEGGAAAAIREAGSAVVAWTEVGAPFEVASARMVLGQAHQLAGSPDR